MTEQLHKNIYNKLDYFIKIKKIPNIIFHGASGSGKRTIVYNFISKIYEDDKKQMKKLTMFVDCAHGKGIKFIREELKFFAKTNINSNNGNLFKSVILLSADKLTIDAQSALRRCIELFSHNTRFFIVVEDKFKLLRPILSRFCDIYIKNPIQCETYVNLHRENIIKTYDTKKFDVIRKQNLKKILTTQKPKCLFSLAEKLYEKGFQVLILWSILKKHGIIQMTKNINFYYFYIKLKETLEMKKSLYF